MRASLWQYPIMAVSLVYETHSITTDNEAGIATGWLPGELSEAGIRLARELGERRRDDGVDAVFCSDLRRAVQTAEIAFAGTNLPVLQDTRLRETNYGEWNGMPVSRLHTERRARVGVPFPGGESWRQAADRTVDLLRELALRWDGKRIVLIGHSAQRYGLRELFERISLEEAVDAPFDWQPGWEYSLDLFHDGLGELGRV